MRIMNNEIKYSVATVSTAAQPDKKEGCVIDCLKFHLSITILTKTITKQRDFLSLES